MQVLYILIPLSFTLALIGLGAFLWAVRSGQFEDTVSPAQSILREDD